MSEIKTLVEELEKVIARGPHEESYMGDYALSSVVAALRIVTLNIETQYTEAIRDRINGG